MKIELSRLRGSRAWWLTLSLFALLNLASWIRFRYFPPCCGAAASVGFPFPVYIGGGMEAAEYYLLGLLLDVAIALTVALLATWIAEWRKT